VSRILRDLATQSKYKKWWIQDGLQNIIPQGYGVYAEGWDFCHEVQQFLLKHRLENQSVLDLGCGIGRLTPGFNSEKYIGVDLNPNAIQEARKLNPHYTFQEVDVNSEYPLADITFAYTVFNHLDADTIKSMKLKSKYILQCEILGTEWSGGGLVSHGKELRTYQQIFEGHWIFDHVKLPYNRYAEWIKKNTDMSFILWKRN